METKEKVAIKIIEKEKLSANDAARVNREIEINKKIKHPNIVSVYEVVQTEAAIYLIMEL